MDRLFALTGYPFFAELSNARMSSVEVKETIAELVASAVERYLSAAGRRAELAGS